MTNIEWGSRASLRACAEWSEAEAGRARAALRSKSIQVNDRDYYVRRAERLDQQSFDLRDRADAMELGAAA